MCAGRYCIKKLQKIKKNKAIHFFVWSIFEECILKIKKTCPEVKKPPDIFGCDSKFDN
jgi:hypothetical protein